MKDYFKYEKGYLLINEEAFFLTSSGNWSETHQLQEKGYYEVQQQANRSFKVFVWVGLLVFASLYISFKSQSQYSLFVGLGLALTVWRYLITETALRCKIPFEKVVQLKFNEIQKEVELHFRNANQEEDRVFLKKIDPKAILFLKVHFDYLIHVA